MNSHIAPQNPYPWGAQSPRELEQGEPPDLASEGPMGAWTRASACWKSFVRLGAAEESMEPHATMPLVSRELLVPSSTHPSQSTPHQSLCPSAAPCVPLPLIQGRLPLGAKLNRGTLSASTQFPATLTPEGCFTSPGDRGSSPKGEAAAGRFPSVRNPNQPTSRQEGWTKGRIPTGAWQQGSPKPLPQPQAT